MHPFQACLYLGLSQTLEAAIGTVFRQSVCCEKRTNYGFRTAWEKASPGRNGRSVARELVERHWLPARVLRLPFLLEGTICFRAIFEVQADSRGFLVELGGHPEVGAEVQAALDLPYGERGVVGDLAGRG